MELLSPLKRRYGPFLKVAGDAAKEGWSWKNSKGRLRTKVKKHPQKNLQFVFNGGILVNYFS
jgi:hypothetical protein